nr:hypothetical protein [Mucilaginibacter sp. X5P1]
MILWITLILFAPLCNFKLYPSVIARYEAIPDCTEKVAYRMVSLIAAKAYFFCLDTKETKNQVSRNASLPHRATALQIRQNLGWKSLRPYCAHYPIRCKNFLCPAITHKATIVLPAFTRSCSTDGGLT